jgi:hypothetical protein
MLLLLERVNKEMMPLIDLVIFQKDTENKLSTCESQQMEPAVVASFDPLKVRTVVITPCWMVILSFILVMFLPLGMGFTYTALFIFLLTVALISDLVLQEDLRFQKVEA